MADRKHAIRFEGPGRTKQQCRDECDINIMMAKYQNTGVLPPSNNFVASYGDFTEIDDYQAAVNQVQDAEDAFMDLPSNIRTRFDNDPAKLLEFASDINNVEEARELGILAPIPVEIPPTPTPPTPPEPSE